jgi:hypothetical protein
MPTTTGYKKRGGESIAKQKLRNKSKNQKTWNQGFK